MAEPTPKHKNDLPNDIDNDSERFVLSTTAIKLDGSGNLPTRFSLLTTGNWENSVKGDFSIDVNDLKQIKNNFDKGIGFPTEDATTGLAIDFAHNYADEAGGWIKGLELAVDQADPSKATLYATPVEWTSSGADAISSGRFKCVSPMGYFGRKDGKLSMWSNPTNLKEKVANVLEGCGLTNIPFLRGMAPIRADATADNLQLESGQYIFIAEDSQKNKGEIMNIDLLRVKDRTALTVPELDFLAENKAKLSAEEVTKFKLDNEPAEGGEGDQPTEDERATLLAIREGKKKVVDAQSEVVEKTRLDALEKTALQYRDDKAQEIVNGHVARGAIKQDAADNWKKRLLSAVADEDRVALETDLKALPDNKIVADEIGSGEDVNAGSTAREQLHALANHKIEAASKAGKELLYTDALKEANREHPELQKQDLAEQGVK